MNILIDINHPAHVHYYRNLSIELQRKGHQIYWTARKQDSVTNLMTAFNIPFFQLPGKVDGRFRKLLRQFQLDWKVFRFCRRNKINIGIGTSVSIAHVSKISKVCSIVFDDDDDDVQPLMTRYVHPVATCILSPRALIGKRKRADTIFYPGYHELAYLHPKRFTPDPKVLIEFGLTTEDRFFIMRFNAFKAHHDVRVSGVSLKQKLQLIDILRPHGHVFITTEREIEPELKQYQLKISPEKAHSLMAFANIFLGDSQTMTSEAAMLGVPSLRCNSLVGKISYLDEQEKRYGLTFGYRPEAFHGLVNHLQMWLTKKDLKEEFQKKRNAMLKDSIDVTAFWIWFIDNFPGSMEQNVKSVINWEKFK